MTRVEVRRVVRQLAAQLKKENIPIRDLVLFGSYATGRADRDSDIDVAIILPPSLVAAERKKLSEIPWLAKQIHVKLEPHLISTADLRNRWLSLSGEIRRDGQRV